MRLQTSNRLIKGWVLLTLCLAIAGCAPVALAPHTTTPEPVSLSVLYTNDEHGWIAGVEPGSGAAELFGHWQDHEMLGKKDEVIVISGGDNFTGPAISTWFKGESTVEIMNAMGYAASAIGNHEFDFGLAALQARLEQANYPYLSANFRRKDNGVVPEELGIRAYTVVERVGLRIAIIGLTTQLAATTTNPAYIANYTFIDYEIALRETMPAVQAEHPDLIIVISHICSDELVRLAKKVSDLGIAVMGAGHCHEVIADRLGSTVILGGGTRFESYAFANLSVLPGAVNPVSNLQYGVRRNQGGEAEPGIAAIISRWEAQTEAELAEVIGYLRRDLLRNSKAMQALVLQTWLWAYPQAEAAITNTGGFRSQIPAGPVTLAEIISVMPFDNVLVVLEVSGSQLKQLFTAGPERVVRAGVSYRDERWVLDRTGEEVDDRATYQVLVTDFLYSGGDNYTVLSRFDPVPEMTNIDWRQPVIDWIRAQESTRAAPLDESINALPPPQ